MATIRIRRVPGAPVIAIRAWLPGGSSAESKPGQALVAGRLLLEGTRERSWRDISSAAESRGAALVADAGYEAQGLAVDALADDWELALEWAAELLRSSTFPEDRCGWLGRQAAGELEQLADHPDVKASWALARQLYGTSARGRPLQGDPESLGALSGSGCRAFHESCLDNGLILAVAGELREAEVEARAGELFGDLPDPRPLAPPEAPEGADDRGPARQTISLPDSEQAQWLCGAVTVPRDDPDYWALSLIGVVLGAGGNLAGRITHRVRELEGLAYSCGVATVAAAGRGPGSLTVAAGTSPEHASAVEAAVTEELERLSREGVTASELSEALAYVLGREPFARETARQWSTLLAQSELFGVPIAESAWVEERWRSVEAETIVETARKYLNPARLKVTVGLPQRIPDRPGQAD